ENGGTDRGEECEPDADQQRVGQLADRERFGPVLGGETDPFEVVTAGRIVEGEDRDDQDRQQHVAEGQQSDEQDEVILDPCPDFHRASSSSPIKACDPANLMYRSRAMRMIAIKVNESAAA